MTGDQLRQLRKSRDLARHQLAVELGVSASAIVKWESNEREIPDWVERDMLRSVKLALPLDEIHALLDLARAEDKGFESILAEAIRQYLDLDSKVIPLPPTGESEIPKTADQPGEEPKTPEQKDGTTYRRSRKKAR